MSDRCECLLCLDRRAVAEEVADRLAQGAAKYAQEDAAIAESTLRLVAEDLREDT